MTDPTNLPPPLTPPDCDLTDFAFMPLDVQRLRDSDLTAEQTPEENWAAVLLWAAGWHQVPAASLPNVEQTIAKFAGYVARGKIDKAWPDVKAGAMRGWVLCADGRWYHSVVAEKANEAWRSKLQHAYDKLADRTRKANKAKAERGEKALPIPPVEWWISAGRPQEFPPDAPGIPPEKALKGKGQGEGQGQGDVPPSGGGADAPPPGPAPTPPPAPKPPAKPKAKKSDDPGPTVATWEAYADAYRKRYGTEPVRNATVNGQLANLVARLGAEDAPEVARFYLSDNKPFFVQATHPVNLLLQNCEGLRTRWKTGMRSDLGHLAAETPYQRSQRERVSDATGGRASRAAPGELPSLPPLTFEAQP